MITDLPAKPKNPLARAAQTAVAEVKRYTSQDEIRAWCETQNAMEGAWAKTVWYYAMTAPDEDQGYIAHRIDGLDAEEVRKATRGHFPEYFGWSEGKMRKHVGLVRHRLSMGMT